MKNVFGMTVRKIRQQKKISQEKFALKIGIDRTYLASVEVGNRNLSLKNIEKIAKGFDMKISDLFKKVEEIMDE